jgi:hypothetical protein
MSGICAQLPFRSRARKTASDDALLDCGHRLAGQAGEGSGPPFQGKRLGRASAVPQGVPVALWSPASGPVHPADIMSPNGGRAALEPAPLRPGVASRRPAHIQEHGVVLLLFRSPLPPVPAR